MIYSRQKLFDFLRDHRLLAFLVIIAGTVLLILMRNQSIHGAANLEEVERVSFSISQLNFQSSERGKLTQKFWAKEIDIIEPNQLRIKNGMEVTSYATNRKFDRLAATDLELYFQAQNTLQIIEKSRIVEGVFPKSFEIEKSGLSIKSSNVKVDFRSQSVFGQNPTLAEYRGDKTQANGGFSFNLTSGDFVLNGPISGEVEKIP